MALGRLSGQPGREPLTPFTAVIGKNGVGKSTLFDAFGFVSDCLAFDVETACDARQRGGYGRLISAGHRGSIRFEIQYRGARNERPITYELVIGLDRTDRPFVQSEVLKQQRLRETYGKPFPFLRLEGGKGDVWAGEQAVEGANAPGEPAKESVDLTDLRQLGIATLGTLKEHPRIARFRDFLKGWYLSYFQPDAARTLSPAGPQRHLHVNGDNIANVVQFMEREYKQRFSTILQKIAETIPGIGTIDTHVTEDRRVLLRFGAGSFQDPFFAQQMSDGTLTLFAYLLLLEDPEPPPFICIEEPENGLYHKLMEVLAREFKAHAGGRKGDPQIFVTTHQPYFLNALSPEEVWILEKGAEGYSTITRASDIADIKNLVAEDLPLGSLWYSDYLDAR